MIEDTPAITVVENNMEYKIVRADGEAATFDVEVAKVAEIEVVEKGDTGCNKCIVKKEIKKKDIPARPHTLAYDCAGAKDSKRIRANTRTIR